MCRTKVISAVLDLTLLSLIQIVKMTQAGEVSVESAPYKDLDTCPLPPSQSEPVCPLITPSSRPQTIKEEPETEKESKTQEEIAEKNSRRKERGRESRLARD